MSEDLRTRERKAMATRAIAGAAWSIGLMAVLWPLRMINASVLSRSAMEVYGFWTYLNMLLEVIPALFIFGGPRAIVYFIPKLEDGSKRRFVLFYGILAVAGVLLGIAIVFIFPVMGGLIGIEHRGWLITTFMLVAIPAETILLVIDAALMGYMRVSGAGKAGGVPQVIVIVGVTAAFIIWPLFCLDNYEVVLTAAMAVRIVISMVWYIVIYLQAFPRGIPHETGRTWLPPGVWRYAGYLQLNQIVDFVYMRADQWIVFGFFGDLTILAGYNLARTFTRFIGMIPLALRGVVFSTLVQFQAEQDMDRSRRTYRLSVLIDSLVSFPVALVMVCFCEQIVGLISQHYRDPGLAAGELLLVMAALSAVTSLGGSISVYIIGRGRSNYTFWVGVVGAVTQLGLTCLFLSLQGNQREAQLGITIARFLGMFLMLGLCALWMRKNMPKAIPSAWLINAVTTITISALVFFCHLHLPTLIVLFVVGTVIVTATNLHQMNPVIRRLILSPWRMLSFVLDEQKIPNGVGKTDSKPSASSTKGSAGP